MWFHRCGSTGVVPQVWFHSLAIPELLHHGRVPTKLPGSTTTRTTDTLHTVPTNAHGRPVIMLADFLDMMCAFHFASLVPSPINDASGVMVVAPSGSLKSSLLMSLSTLYPTSCVCDSNWYYGKLLKMKSAFFNRTVRSIIIPELSSLYAGDPRTGGRMEQMLQQMAGEGSISTQENDSRWERYDMRAQVFAAMTPEFATKKHPFWEEGFHRRFLWVHLAMDNNETLLDYLTAWKRAEIEVSQPMVEPAQGIIADNLSYAEKMRIRRVLEPQKSFGPNHTRFVFLCRAMSALKWHYARIRSHKSAFDTLKRFSVCLSDQAALLVIPDEKQAVDYRKSRERNEVEQERKQNSKRTKRRRKKVLVPVPEQETIQP